MPHASVVPDSATPWTVACQAPLSIGFSRQDYWSGLPFPPSGDPPNSETELTSLTSPALAGHLRALKNCFQETPWKRCAWGWILVCNEDRAGKKAAFSFSIVESSWLTLKLKTHEAVCNLESQASSGQKKKKKEKRRRLKEVTLRMTSIGLFVCFFFCRILGRNIVELFDS